MDKIFKNKKSFIIISIVIVAVIAIISATIPIVMYNNSKEQSSQPSNNITISGNSIFSGDTSPSNNSSTNSSQTNTNISSVTTSSVDNTSTTNSDNGGQTTNSTLNTSSNNSSNHNSNTQSFFAKRPEKNVRSFPITNEFFTPQYEQKIFKDSKSGKELRYNIYVPENYSSQKKYPVLLFMHGMGTIGTDFVSATNGIKPVFENSADIVKKAIIIAPQAPDANGFWPIHNRGNDECGWGGIAMRLLLDIEKNYSCDTNRIYVTGNSMGGHGTWNLIETYSDHFAAAIPICGWGDNPGNASKLKNIPIWIYHGDADPTVPVAASRNMYNTIKSAGGTKIKYTELPGVNHDSWTPAYKNRELISWLFSQNKAENPLCQYEILPYFRVVDHNNNTIITERDSTYISFTTIDSTDCLEFKLTDNGAKKLEKAYKNSSGKTFSVYYGNKKIMTFTATKGSVNKSFYIINSFNSYEYYEYVDRVTTYMN